MISAKLIQKRCENPDGKERIIRDSLHYGVGNSAYTYAKDATRAGLIPTADYIESNGCFVHLTQTGLKRFCLWLNRSAIYPNFGAPYYGAPLSETEKGQQ